MTVHVHTLNYKYSNAPIDNPQSHPSPNIVFHSILHTHLTFTALPFKTSIIMTKADSKSNYAGSSKSSNTASNALVPRNTDTRGSQDQGMTSNSSSSTFSQSTHGSQVTLTAPPTKKILHYAAAADGSPPNGGIVAGFHRINPTYVVSSKEMDMAEKLEKLVLLWKNVQPRDLHSCLRRVKRRHPATHLFSSVVSTVFLGLLQMLFCKHKVFSRNPHNLAHLLFSGENSSGGDRVDRDWRLWIRDWDCKICFWQRFTISKRRYLHFLIVYTTKPFKLECDSFHLINKSEVSSLSLIATLSLLKLSSTATSSSPPPPRFLVSFQVASSTSNGLMLRRQETTGSFITSEGAPTADCLQSPLYSINALGQLLVADGRVFSFSKSLRSARFTPSNSLGDISTTWKPSGATLNFDNSIFLNGTATPCLDSLSNTIEVYYLETPPTFCSTVVLTIVPRQYLPYQRSLMPNKK